MPLTHHHYYLSQKPSTTGHRPPLMLCIKTGYVLPASNGFSRSSNQPKLHLPVRDCHSIMFCPRQPYYLRALCPVYCHLSLVTLLLCELRHWSWFVCILIQSTTTFYEKLWISYSPLASCEVILRSVWLRLALAFQTKHLTLSPSINFAYF